MAKKKVGKAIREAVLPGGEAVAITGENGRYWVCGNAQFLKSRVTVRERQKEVAPEIDTAEEPESVEE